jgi:AcrR family transcriptional regulator
MKLFAEYGYHATTTDEIAKKLGKSKASIYYYFSGKDEILKAIMSVASSRMKTALAIGKSSLPPREKLRKFVQYHIELNVDRPELAKVLFEQLNVLPKRTRDSMKRQRKEVDAVLQNIIQRGADDGIFVVDNVKVASYLIFGICNWVYHWYHPGGGLTPEQISEIAVNLLENGILKRVDGPDGPELADRRLGQLAFRNGVK